MAKENLTQVHQLTGDPARKAQLDNLLDKLEDPMESTRQVKNRRRQKQAIALGSKLFVKIDSVVKWATKTK